MSYLLFVLFLRLISNPFSHYFFYFLGSRLYDMIPMETTVNTYVLSKKTVLTRDDAGNIVLPHGNIEPAEFAKEKINPETNAK